MPSLILRGRVGFQILGDYSTMGNNSSKGVSDNQPLPGTPAGFIFKEYDPSGSKILPYWTDITQDDLKLNGPKWSTFDIPKLDYLAHNWKSVIKPNKMNVMPILIGTWVILNVFRTLKSPFYKIPLLS